MKKSDRNSAAIFFSFMIATTDCAVDLCHSLHTLLSYRMHTSWAAVLALVLAALISFAGAYSVELEPNSQECFILTVSEGASCSGNFEIVEGGETAVVVKVTDPDGKLRYEADGEIEGTFSFLARSSGDHVMCLTNGGGHRRPTETQVVGFNFRAGYAVKKGGTDELTKAMCPRRRYGWRRI